MKKDTIRPELRRAVLKAPRLPFALRPLLGFSRFIFNIATKKKPVAGVYLDCVTYQGVEIRIFTPGNVSCDGAIIWFHGGGHIAGRPNQLDKTASQTARRLGVKIIVPQYRLAPEYPFPADLDDAYTAWQWLLQNASDLNIDSNRIAIVGNSAGGGLAAALAQKIYDIGSQQPAAQVLFYPMLDDRTAANKQLDADNHFLWNNKANRVAWNAYLAPNQCGANALPDYAAPARRQNLNGLPKTWIGVGSIDLFYDECVEYAARLKAQQVDCELFTVEGAPHVFEVLAPEERVTQNFVTSATNFLFTVLSESGEAIDSHAPVAQSLCN
ncbi:alpha/beta hydrolase [Maricurvus nonylphenolicus]|uniref:alpha/beta hydrolase n=1 Tax=Maricurvus nonylphenolicus TaxID=1008307 RepID=UPI0036F1C31A